MKSAMAEGSNAAFYVTSSKNVSTKFWCYSSNLRICCSK